MTESDEQPALKSFELTEEQLAVLPPSMGGPRRKTPRKPHAPWQDPPELLIPNDQMTDELWAAWERPLDHEKIPSNTRKVALMLWRRDGNICQLCGLSVEIHLRKSHPGMASPGHIVPVRRYDPEYDASHLNVWGNVRLTHLHCNTAHRDFGAELIAVARLPSNVENGRPRIRRQRQRQSARDILGAPQLAPCDSGLGAGADYRPTGGRLRRRVDDA